MEFKVSKCEIKLKYSEKNFTPTVGKNSTQSKDHEVLSKCSSLTSNQTQKRNQPLTIMSKKKK